MAVRLAVAALFGALVFAGSLAPQTARHAAACSLAPTALEGLARGAQVVIVGEVINERLVRDRPNSYNVYESTVRVEAVLKGTVEPLVTLSPLGSLGADCTGGPRLQEGERVLLMFGEFRGDSFVVGHEWGKYVLANGEAQVAFQNIPPEPPIPVGEALRTVAAITGASQAELDAALSFAMGEPLPPLVPEPEPVSDSEPQPDAELQPVNVDDDGGQPVLLIALASLGLLAVTGALFALRLRRSRQ
ncbi:MAG: hypothetical protein IH958_05915 [Chloroflexi bacterium]|nr:hypothetical protein [Chloroflexota bacterium]